MIVNPRCTDEKVISHSVRKDIGHDAHDACISFDQRVWIAVIFIGLQKSQAVQGCVVPAANISALVIAISEPHGLIAATQRFQYLNRLFIFWLAPKKSSKEIHLLMCRLIDDQFGAIRIGLAHEFLVAFQHLPAQIFVLLLPTLLLNVMQNIDGIRALHKTNVTPGAGGEPLHAGAVGHAQILLRSPACHEPVAFADAIERVINVGGVNIVVGAERGLGAFLCPCTPSVRGVSVFPIQGSSDLIGLRVLDVLEQTFRDVGLKRINLWLGWEVNVLLRQKQRLGKARFIATAHFPDFIGIQKNATDAVIERNKTVMPMVGILRIVVELTIHDKAAARVEQTLNVLNAIEMKVRPTVAAVVQLEALLASGLERHSEQNLVPIPLVPLNVNIVRQEVKAVDVALRLQLHQNVGTFLNHHRRQHADSKISRFVQLVTNRFVARDEHKAQLESSFFTRREDERSVSIDPGLDLHLRKFFVAEEWMARMSGPCQPRTCAAKAESGSL